MEIPGRESGKSIISQIFLISFPCNATGSEFIIFLCRQQYFGYTLTRPQKILLKFYHLKVVQSRDSEIPYQNSLTKAEREMKIKETYQYRFIKVIFEEGEIPNRRKASL